MSEPRFTYKSIVKITNGFYRGHKGVVIGYYPRKYNDILTCYNVKLEDDSDVFIDEINLELVEVIHE